MRRRSLGSRDRAPAPPQHKTPGPPSKKKQQQQINPFRIVPLFALTHIPFAHISQKHFRHKCEIVRDSNEIYVCACVRCLLCFVRVLMERLNDAYRLSPAATIAPYISHRFSLDRTYRKLFGAVPCMVGGRTNVL